MRLSDHQIKKHLKIDENINEGRLQEVLRKSKDAFYANEAEEVLSAAEFLRWQGKYIHKRWWVLQGAVLFVLWALLELAESSCDMQRYMGIAAPMFAVLVLPELWKNRGIHAMEIESSAYYSLRQVYAARIVLFALADSLLLCCFFLAAVPSGKMMAEELIIQFFLPYLVTCCICFRTLYSRKINSEIFALFLCIVWCAVWTQLVLDHKIYDAVSTPIWLVMIAISLLYLGYCIYRGQKNLEKLWEVSALWN